jgi:hypothetical protein
LRGAKAEDCSRAKMGVITEKETTRQQQQQQQQHDQ